MNSEQDWHDQILDASLDDGITPFGAAIADDVYEVILTCFRKECSNIPDICRITGYDFMAVRLAIVALQLQERAYVGVKEYGQHSKLIVGIREEAGQ